MSTRSAFAALCAAALLAGCSDGDVAEVRAWMEQTRAQTRVSVPPLSEPKTFIPFAYAHSDVVDPFSQDKLLVELARAGGGGNRPDTDRPKEPLEYFPLDTVRMVGAIRKGGVNYGLLQIDRQVYQVRVGQRVGQNYGVVTAVSDVAVDIRETVQDATGDWVERMTKLELLEGKENSK
ncbi:MAG TPA: pilus assembly protein PilP [Telluria sp.]|nr:pilus assembly protein PilP [Telluria sp.]